jgi:sigma-B regulation protein RsbU (phosphoserine phosphatase)
MAAARNSRGNAASPDPVKKFWQRVSDGLELTELWGQFTTEARTGYSLYSREVDWETIGKETGFRRGWKIAQAFFWALLMKLSPARRVLLLVAFILLVAGKIEFRGQDANASFNLAAFGVIILLGLLALELADRVTMKRDLEIARDIQRWLVPAVPPAVPGFDIAFATRPANTVAGDYYDAFYRSSASGERLFVAVADVAGKSVPAALLMATFQASLHALTAGPEPLGELVLALNRYTCTRSLGGQRFTTAFLAELDTSARTLHFVCAGHNPPLLRRVAGDITELSAGGLPLGIDAGAAYEQDRAALAPGDLVLIYTDGLLEAVNERGEEFGLARATEILQAVPGETAAQTLQHLIEAASRFAGRAPQHDDITCLLLRCVP